MRCRRSIAKRAVGSHGIEMPSPALDQKLGLPQRIEYLIIQKLVSEFAVEAFIVSVLPKAPGFDVQGLHANPRQPVPNGDGCEHTAIVRPDVILCSMLGKEISENMQRIIGAEC